MGGACGVDCVAVRGVVVLLVVLAGLGLWVAGRDGGRAAGVSGRVVIFHETHTHGKLATFPRYVGLVDELSAGREGLFLGNGDDLSTSYGGAYTGGRHVVEAFNASGLDADTFGFSELLFSVDRLKKVVAASDFDWVSANVREGDDVLAAQQGARRYVIEEVDGVRVGITGLLGTRFSFGQPPRTAFGPVRVLDPARALSAVVPEMREHGAEVVVVLSHMMHEDTLRVVDRVPGIDVALGTHLGDATLRPDIVGETIVAVAGPADMQALGELTLTLRDGRVASHAFRRHVMQGRDEADPEVEAVLARYE